GALPVILGGDHTTPNPAPTGVPRHGGWGRVPLIPSTAHADTAATQSAPRSGTATPRRRPTEPAAAPGAGFLRTGLPASWPGPSRRRSGGWPASGCAATR